MTGPPARMHADEVAIDAGLVERLVAEQFAELADLPVRTIASTGTVNAIYRLGDEFCVRLPRQRAWSDTGDRELTWLPLLAPHLTLPVPEPVKRGEPGCGYPFDWAIYRWIDGSLYDPAAVPDEPRAAADLAAFVHELRAIDPTDAPPAGRRPLAELDAETRAAIDASGDRIDQVAATAAWARALEAPLGDGERTWIHNDLLPTNLLVDPGSGRLTAVLDFGGAGVGDPAFDVVPAWSVFSPTGRTAYRTALGVDDATWDRARGYALHQATLIIPYYAETNPAFVAMARRTVAQVLTDLVRPA